MAFESTGHVDENLTTEWDIHARDLQTGATIRASRPNSVDDIGSSHSNSASISPNGRYVAFYSSSTWDAADTSPDTDIYVRDRDLGITILASRASGASGAKGNRDSGEPVVSNAGTVAFESNATNLHPVDTDDTFDIFVRDMLTGGMLLGSVTSAGAKANAPSNIVAPSSDGFVVGFESAATNLGGNGLTSQVFVHALPAPPPPSPPPPPPPPDPEPDPGTDPPASQGPPGTCQGRTATITGTRRNDRITGTKRADVIVGRGGNDVINAGKGKDLVCGGRGADGVRAGAQADRVFGGPGDDVLSGEAGNDRILGERGDDAINGGTGKDACLGGAGRNRIRAC